MATIRERITDRVRAMMAAARGRVPQGTIGEPRRYGGARSTISPNVGGNLTPGKVAAMLRAADMGRPARLCELLEDIEDRDTHLVSVLGTRKRAVTALSWDVLPSDDRRRPRAVAAFVKARLMAIDNFEDGLLDLLDAVPKGYGVVESEWYNRPGEVGVSRLHYRPQRWFVPDQDDPERWRMLDDANPTEGIELPPFRFITHVSKAKSGFPVRAGLGRTLVWWYLFKNRAVQDWVSYGELFGVPARIGRYPVGTKPADVDKLEEALDRLGVDASAVIQSDMDIKFLTDTGGKTGADTYERLCEYVDKGNSKAVLGQTLTTDAGKNGSRALGDVHNDVRRDLLVADARQLARTLNRDLVAPMVAFQYGPDEPAPSFAFDTEPAADEQKEAEAQEARGKVFVLARSLGVPVPLAQVQLELGVRMPVGGEAVLPPVVAAGAAPAAVQGADRAHAPACFAEAPMELPATLAEVERAAAAFRTDGGEQAWKGLITAIRDRLAGARSVDEVPTLLVELAGQLQLEPFVGALADAVLTGELLGRVHAAGDERALGAEFPQVPPKDAVEFWTTKAALRPREFYALEAAARSHAFTISRFTTLSALAEAKDHLERVIADGGTLADFEDGLDGVYARAGMDPLYPSRLKLVFDNNTFTAYSVGKWRQITKPESLARRPLVRYHTMADSLVRPTHRPMEGWVAPADDPIWDVWWPMNGHGCRCSCTAHSEEEAQRNGWIVMGGRLPRDVGDGAPLVPDRGWAANPAKQPHQLDWSRFPADWRRANGAPEVA